MIEKFDIYVYTKDLVFIGVIDHFSSLRWRRKYFEAGEFELHMPFNSETMKYLIKDNIIIRDDAVENGIVESWQIDDRGEYVEVTIFGRFLSSILDRRIVKNRINFSGKILDGERRILNEMTPFSMLEIRDTILESNNIVFQCTYKNVYEYLNKLSKNSTIAHRITADVNRKKFIYDNYQGLDRTDAQDINPRYEFSEDRENIEESKYVLSSVDEKNYALIGGSGEGSNRIIVEVKRGNFKDLELKEIFIDASSEALDEDTTLSDYKKTLFTIGNNELLEVSETVEVSVYFDDYKKYWDLGDIVNVKKESWNVSMKQRIIEVEEIIEDKNQKIYATFGTPLAESLEVEE
ncbi:MAG: siphovirus ReqiPepy6 Gp37-like family protein [Ruminococcus sp.]|nr:siphovirus ReqiPepy6 Gp37-like family protein [Ruminococcus sp.]